MLSEYIKCVFYFGLASHFLYCHRLKQKLSYCLIHLRKINRHDTQFLEYSLCADCMTDFYPILAVRSGFPSLFNGKGEISLQQSASKLVPSWFWFDLILPDANLDSVAAHQLAGWNSQIRTPRRTFTGLQHDVWTQLLEIMGFLMSLREFRVCKSNYPKAWEGFGIAKKIVATIL